MQFGFYCVICTFVWPINYEDTIIIYHNPFSFACMFAIYFMRRIRSICAKCKWQILKMATFPRYVWLRSFQRRRQLMCGFLVFTTFCSINQSKYKLFFFVRAAVMVKEMKMKTACLICSFTISVFSIYVYKLFRATTPGFEWNRVQGLSHFKVLLRWLQWNWILKWN